MESKKKIDGRSILAHVVLIILAFLCWFVFKMNTDSDPDGSKSAAKRAKKGGRA